MKKHNLCSIWHRVFMSNTDKQALINLYFNNSKGDHQVFYMLEKSQYLHSKFVK